MAIVRQTAAFNVQAIRDRLLRHTHVPAMLLNKAIAKLDKKLDAKETKFFTYQGQVVERADVEDHAAQLSAIDKVLSMTGVYAKETDKRSAPPQVTLRITPNGVFEMVVGTGDANEVIQAANGDANGHGGLAPAVQLELGADYGDSSAEQEPVEQVQVIKVSNGRGRMPDAVLRQLFSDE